MCEVPTPSGPDEKQHMLMTALPWAQEPKSSPSATASTNTSTPSTNGTRTGTLPSQPLSPRPPFSRHGRTRLAWNSQFSLTAHMYLRPKTKNPWCHPGSHPSFQISCQEHLRQAKQEKKKSLAGSSWGREKEVLTTTNKAIGRSLLTYGAPIWTLGLSTTHWQTLQAGQNAALRTTRLRPPTRATTTTTTCEQADNLFKPLLCSLVSPELKAGESFFQWFHGILKYEGALQAWQANRHLSSEKCSAT